MLLLWLCVIFPSQTEHFKKKLREVFFSAEPVCWWRHYNVIMTLSGAPFISLARKSGKISYCYSLTGGKYLRGTAHYSWNMVAELILDCSIGFYFQFEALVYLICSTWPGMIGLCLHFLLNDYCTTWSHNPGETVKIHHWKAWQIFGDSFVWECQD